MNPEIDLIQLHAFVAVADAGGFSRAAGPAASTQPTLSRQVKSLEDALGRPLFNRSAKKVSLTPFGRALLGRARALLAQAEAMVGSGRAPAGALTGALHLGAADSVVLSRLPDLLRRFLAKHPGVHVHVHTVTTPEILNLVREGRFDAGLCLLPGAYPGLVLDPLWSDRFLAVAPPRHLLAGKTVALSRFARERQLGIRADSLSFQMLSSAFQRAGHPYIIDMSFDTFSLVAAFVAAGLGVGIVSEAAAKALFRRKQIAPVHVREIESVPRTVGVARNAGREPDEALAAFLKEIRRN